MGPSCSSAAAVARSIPSGTADSPVAGTTTCSAYPPPPPVRATTACPARPGSTPAPTRRIRPATALPGTYGGVTPK